MAIDENGVYMDGEKHRERLHREDLAHLRDKLQRERDVINSERMQDREIIKQQLKNEAAERAARLKKEESLAVIQLEHNLEPEKRDLNFRDIVRESDIRLQALQVELALRDQIAVNEHNRSIDALYQQTAMEITKEISSLKSEQEKEIAIIESINRTKLILEEQQHDQTIEQKYIIHKHEMEKKEQAHLHELIRDKLQAKLHRKNFSHEEKVRVVTLLMMKELGLNKGEVSMDIMQEWAEDFVRNEEAMGDGLG